MMALGEAAFLPVAVEGADVADEGRDPGDGGQQQVAGAAALDVEAKIENERLRNLLLTTFSSELPIPLSAISETVSELLKPENIKDDEILFGEGLGLDSLDAVEIVVLLQRNFGLEVKDMNQGKKIFYSVETLVNYIYENQKK